MGFLKKLTRPISKVLDKIVPNEIKPALPFLAAATPFLLPGGFGIGGLNPMLSRAIASGAANLGAQLAQEGSEGDFSGLSTLLAAGTGALTAGGPSKAIGVDSPAAKNAIVRSEATGAPKFFADKAAGMDPGFTKSGLEALGGASEYLSGVGETLRTNPFSMEGLKAAAIPATQGGMDLAIAETRRINKQGIIDDALGGLGEGATDADRALAIRLAMQQYGFGEDEIEETITSAGYKDGGIIGLQVEMIEGKKDGGLIDLGGKEMDLRGGGFVPIGKKEKADDVPARLSKNEFVMTADAVRAAGGGSVNKGAKRMYDLMDRLEARA